MSWFTSVILLGPTLPWLLLNSLIDCDRDTGGDLNYLTYSKPNSGFQYRENAYWSSQCVVGKVLVAGCGVNQVVVWIGLCLYTAGLARTQCAQIHQLDPLEYRHTIKDIDGITTRTSPLGPDNAEYPINRYNMLVPNRHVEDIIRIEKLSLKGLAEQADLSPVASRGMRASEAAIDFAFIGISLPMFLRYNVDFICAFPCIGGPLLRIQLPGRQIR